MPFAIVGPAPTEIEAALGLLYTQTVEKAVEFRGELTLYIKPDSIVAVCRALKNHPDLHFDMLSDLTAVDHLNDQDTGQ
ncbi:MAG: NADH-quinone oxidoreductase subunit C, partial [bacterium]|nr:NADH-quinone oxidoreductase subunit C [bacterium]